MSVRVLRLHRIALVALIGMMCAGPVRAAGGTSPASQPLGVADQQPAQQPLGPLVLEDSPETFKPKRVRNEQEQDRLESLSLFSAARMLELDGKDAEALRFYQRAFRYNPQSASTVRAIVSLAIRMNRQAEAVRYALAVPNADVADPLVLSRLSEYLAGRGDWQRAAALYEKAVAACDDAESEGLRLVLMLQLARIDHLIGQYEKAAEGFHKVFDAVEHSQDLMLSDTVEKLLLEEPQTTYSLMGECSLQAGLLDEAESAFKKADEHSPNKALLDYNLARVDAKRDKPESALKRLNAAFDEQLANQGIDPYELLAELLDELGRKSELVETLKALRAKSPENVPLGYFLAQQYCEEKKVDQAVSLYRELLKKSPTVTGYRALAHLFRETNDYEKLLDVMVQAVEQTAGLEPLAEDGRTLAEDDELVQAVLKIARQRLKETPDEFGYSGRLAVALLALEADQYDDAGEFFERAIEAGPDHKAEVLLSWGLGLLVDEQYERAATVFQRGIDEKPELAEKPIFYFYLAGALEMAGQSEQAEAAARKAVELKPDSPRFHSRVAWILYHNERYDEAIAAYTELVERFDPEYDSSEVRDVVREAKVALSNLLVLAERPDEAEKWLEQVLDEFPEDASAMNDLGYLWADAGRNLPRARTMIEHAVRAEPDNPAYRDSLGWVLFRMGKFDEAVASLEKAALDEPDPVILDHLGDAYQRAGKLDKARDAWKQAVERLEEDGQKPDTADKIRKKIHDNQPHEEN